MNQAHPPVMVATHGPFAGIGGCALACCAPGTRKELARHRVPLSNAARHAFLLAIRHARLPRQVLLKIFELSATEERRLVAAPVMAPSSRRARALMCEEAIDDLSFSLDGVGIAPP